ncbi:MAG: PAS domain S-box protein [Cyanobacteria bacterium Co-bin8]|nr:PAS domain S-box protein [Cyanobacteria bacterium Co-bin8]
MTEKLPLTAGKLSQRPQHMAVSVVGDNTDLSQADILRELEVLRQENQQLKQEVCDRTATVDQLKQQIARLEQQSEEHTAALRESNDSLIEEIVERQQADVALRAAHDQLQAILDAVPGIVSWISADLRYLGVNRHLASTFNLPAEAFIGQDIGFLHTSNEFNTFVKDFFAADQQDAYREISAYVGGSKRRFLIVAQKYNQGHAAFTVGIDISQRNEAEEALRKAEAKYRNIFENIVEGIFQTTADGQYLSANPALARIYGYSSPEEMMANLTSIQQQLYVKPLRREEFIQALLLQGEVKNFESEIYRKDGSVIWISENARAVRDETGTLLYFEGTVEDITERKEAQAALQRANEELEQRVTRRTAALTDSNQRLLGEIRERQRVERALRDSEAELRALFAAMTDVITVFDAEGHYLNMVATNSELLYSPDTERIGKTVYEVLPPYQATLFMRHIHQALNTGRAVRLMYSLPIGEWTGQNPTNGEVAADDFEKTAWYSAIVSPLPGNRAIWVARDITQRRRADIALQRAEEKYRSIFENVAEGILQVTPEGKFLSANPALADMLGYSSPAELMGQVSDINRLYVDPELRRQMVERLHSQPEGITGFESQVYRADGEIIWVSENSRVVRDNYGEILYYEGTAADITQRKQAEDALQESQRALATLLGNLAGMAYRRLCNDERILDFVSDGCFELTGYHPEDLIHQSKLSFGSLVHPDDHGYVGTHLEAARLEKRSFEMIYRIITASGQEKWVLEKGIWVWDEAEEPVAIEGFVTDITDRKRVEEALKAEQEESERLLLNILPQPIAEELKREQKSIAYRFDEVTILFADIVNFTGLSSAVSPAELVDTLNQVFSTFDRLAEKHGLEKIKTIGDAYMVVGGLPQQMTRHAEAVAQMALDMQQAISLFKRSDDNSPFNLRIGMDTGPVVAGVIGMKKFSYDLWGDAVNVASRMESQGQPNRIQVTANLYEQLKDSYQFERRGIIDVKGKGLMTTYWLLGQK